MRTARKTRQHKHLSVAKSNGSSLVATAQVTETLDISPPVDVESNIAARRGMVRVPTHVVPVPNERRQYPRARLRLPLKVVRIAGRRESEPQVLYTVNISSSGLYARCPHELLPGTPVDLEVELVRRMAGRGNVRMLTQAHVVRLERDGKNGWHSVAFTFDDITFQRDDILPPRFSHQ
ncbi:MAG: PilZ domain-containing protein [Candidatus Acidiferrales bacterium]